MGKRNLSKRDWIILVAMLMVILSTSAFVFVGISNREYLPSPWWFIPINVYSNDPNARMEQLIYQSEGGGQIKQELKEWQKTLPPPHLTYERNKGGLGP